MTPKVPVLDVHRAKPAEFDTVLPACVEAFADEAVSVWVLPDPELRRRLTHELLSDSLLEATEDGQLVVAFADGEPVGASIWVTVSEAESPPELPESTDPVRQRMATVMRATAARHPREAHIYLSSMAVLPSRRGLGAGTAMLRHGIDHARSLGLPLYLEASTPENRKLYARHGFTDHGDPIQLPDQGPTLQPMWLVNSGPGGAR